MKGKVSPIGLGDGRVVSRASKHRNTLVNASKVLA